MCQDCRKGTLRRNARSKHLLDTYGITQEEYDALFAAQGGACAICKGVRSYNLQVDHDHSTEKLVGTRQSIRGLLCKACNKRLLPAAKDNPLILGAAIKYLVAPPAWDVL